MYNAYIHGEPNATDPGPVQDRSCLETPLSDVVIMIMTCRCHDHDHDHDDIIMSSKSDVPETPFLTHPGQDRVCTMRIS